jgi:hypothetical protein
MENEENINTTVNTLHFTLSVFHTAQLHCIVTYTQPDGPHSSEREIGEARARGTRSREWDL